MVVFFSKILSLCVSSGCSSALNKDRKRTEARAEVNSEMISTICQPSSETGQDRGSARSVRSII